MRSRALLPTVLGFILAATALFAIARWLPKPPAPRLFGDPACARAYEAFFAGPAIELQVVFGYKDTRPARFVADRYERLLFIQRLLEPCHSGSPRQTCGFTRSEEDMELFIRSFRGPDGKARQLRLRATGSSAGPDDQENRENPFQGWMTANARKALREGLLRADAVFYDGHSRAGGGPDFGPPRLSSSRHVAYGWYRERRAGLIDLKQALSAKESRARLLGLFSCASSEHFARELLSARKDLGLIATPELIYFSDALEGLDKSLSALLEMKCQPDFERMISSGQAGIGKTELLGGFFSPKP
ncbi:MAG: hypothetical protein NDJ89_04870 [Oligoflexia bacterium]|nr:hypothetical protein [Oligoflexia bacterium]